MPRKTGNRPSEQGLDVLAVDRLGDGAIGVRKQPGASRAHIFSALRYLEIRQNDAGILFERQIYRIVKGQLQWRGVLGPAPSSQQ